jgi:hypothetical protein
MSLNTHYQKDYDAIVTMLIPGENVAWLDTLDSTPKKVAGNRRKQDANAR